MADNQIIDNQKDLVVDRINEILESSEKARFAVGYLFISGLTPIADQIKDLDKIYLLIGNTSNQATIEQLAEAHSSIEDAKDQVEADAYRKRIEVDAIADETAASLRVSLELTDQEDSKQSLLQLLCDMAESGRLKTRVYTKGRLHSKAYIFDYGPIYDQAGKPIKRLEDGIAIVGSSNLSLSGLTHNTELNVVVQGNGNHEALGQWFDGLWAEGQDFDARLMTELKASWALAETKPHDVYLKTLYTLVGERLEGSLGDEDVLWRDEITEQLADFQKVAVRQAIQQMRDFGGCFVADVVGMGKSFIGAALVKHFERSENARPLIICPAPLVEMWEEYNEVYALNARVLSMSKLREGADSDVLDDIKYRDRDFVLVDESHNFRHSSIQRYKVLQNFMAKGRKACLLTATPRNKSAWDIYNQLKLFHLEDRTEVPIDPPNLRDYFRLVERGERRLQDLLGHVLIRRTRNHVLRWYGFDSETELPVDPRKFQSYLSGDKKAYVLVGGEPEYFPKRTLETVTYSIEDTYQGLYDQLRSCFAGTTEYEPGSPVVGRLTFARYGLWHYVKNERRGDDTFASLQRVGPNLRGLMRVLLFKRFESSVFAFRETLARLMDVHLKFLAALEDGFVPAGEDAQQFLYGSDLDEEGEFLDTLRDLSTTYPSDGFHIGALENDIRHDLEVMSEILKLVEPISPDQDAKLQVLLSKLNSEPLNSGKRLIFTQYADTARYLFDNIPSGNDVEVIHSGDKSKAKIVARFSPSSNPQLEQLSDSGEINTLIATDVLSEGLNLQDCDKIVNYDLHWNPVRLIQRFGRIDRIGTTFEEVRGYNFLPETGLEKNLGLTERLQLRIQEIHDTIGEDASILDPGEKLNEGAMYSIYSESAGELAALEDEDGLEFGEAEEMLRQLKADDPEEFQRIQELPDGIRSSLDVNSDRVFVFCRAGRYRQLYVIGKDDEISTRDAGEILSQIRCEPETGPEKLPPGYNQKVMEVRRQFASEVARRASELKHRPGLTQGQRFVLVELERAYAATEDPEIRNELETLEKAFRSSLPNALNRQLNALRRASTVGDELVAQIQVLYHEFGMRTWGSSRDDHRSDASDEIRIVCSEALPSQS